MKTLKSLAIVFCVSLFLLATGARPDDFDKKTTITFSGPVQVADTQLPAGTYVFKLADTSDRHVVQIFNADETQVIATIMATPDYRVTPTGDTVVKFAETSDGSETAGTIPNGGIAIKEWFFPGEGIGEEFPVAPQQQAAALQPEPLTEPAPSPEPQAESPQAATPAPAEPAAPEAAAPPAAAEQAAPAETPQPAQAAPEQPAAPEELPQTASQMPLMGLIGILALAAAASFRIMSKRWA